MRPAALLGWADDRAKGSVRGRTVSAVWSPGSRKVKKRGRDSRICLEKLARTGLFTDNQPPPKSRTVVQVYSGRSPAVTSTPFLAERLIIYHS